MVMLVNTCENSCVRVTQKLINMDMLGLLSKAANEHHAHFAANAASHSILTGLCQEIDPDRPPKNFKDAMSCKDTKKECMEFHNGKALAIVKQLKEARTLGTLTHWGTKRRMAVQYEVRMVVRGDQQIEGESFIS
jgi:hypothetical protein